MKQHTRVILAAILLLVYGVCLGISGQSYVEVSSLSRVEAGSNGYHKVFAGVVDTHTTATETQILESPPVTYQSTKVELIANKALVAAFDSALFRLFDGQRHVHLSSSLGLHRARLLFPAHYFW